MCYFLYGAFHGDVDENYCQNAFSNCKYKLRLGSKHDVKSSVKNVSSEYRVTDTICDCESPIGKNNAYDLEIIDFVSLFNEAKNIKGVRYIYFCKTWAGKTNKKEIVVNLHKIDIKDFLVTLNENCLYTFEL